MDLELRMFSMVPYNLSPIQQGIQCAHSLVRYGQNTKKYSDKSSEFHNRVLYNRWADFWETLIILNGGTTNRRLSKLGTLNQHLITLKDIGIEVSEFYEPDLGDQLLCISFILDERVFDLKKYPDYNGVAPYSEEVESEYKQWKTQFPEMEYAIDVDKVIKLRKFLATGNNGGRFTLA